MNGILDVSVSVSFGSGNVAESARSSAIEMWVRCYVLYRWPRLNNRGRNAFITRPQEPQGRQEIGVNVVTVEADAREYVFGERVKFAGGNTEAYFVCVS